MSRASQQKAYRRQADEGRADGADGVAWSATQQRILDAACRSVLAVGFRRTTLTDVAKAADVSRMTVYRNYPSVQAILQDLMAREFSGVLAPAAGIDPAAIAPDAARALIVDTAIDALDRLADHPLFLRLREVDPELLLPYITERDGRFQEQATAALTGGLRAAIAMGAVRDDDPERLARSMMLAMRGFAYVSKDGWSRKRRAAVLGDLRTMFEALLAPETAR